MTCTVSEEALDCILAVLVSVVGVRFPSQSAGLWCSFLVEDRACLKTMDGRCFPSVHCAHCARVVWQSDPCAATPGPGEPTIVLRCRVPTPAWNLRLALHFNTLEKKSQWIVSGNESKTPETLEFSQRQSNVRDESGLKVDGNCRNVYCRWQKKWRLFSWYLQLNTLGRRTISVSTRYLLKLDCPNH